MPRLSVDDVIAHAVYDPVARRQRYLKTRQLKGRKSGGVKIGIGSRIIDANTPIGSSKHYSGHVNVTQARQAASAAKQIADIKGRLDQLRSHLKDLLAKKAAQNQTQTKSKTSSSSKTEPSTKSNSSAADKPKTAKQKQAAKESLKKAQEVRAQQQKQEPNAKPDLTLDEQITRTRAVIADVQTKLRTAIERARTQTASNGR
jgi:hypothetical protein